MTCTPPGSTLGLSWNRSVNAFGATSKTKARKARKAWKARKAELCEHLRVTLLTATSGEKCVPDQWAERTWHSAQKMPAHTTGLGVKRMMLSAQRWKKCRKQQLQTLREM
eukprot:148050-Rhodomonas_salina.2